MDINLREVSYKTFAKLFYYPDKELAEFLLEGIISEFVDSLQLEGVDNNSVSEWLKKFSDTDIFLETIQVEYTRLFINSYPTLPAPSFKSYYVEKEIFGESTEKVIESYNRYHFKVSEEISEPADNIAIELEFVYRLIESNNPLPVQMDFIKNEILSWIESFQAKIDDFALIPLYPYIINVIVNYLKKDVKKY